jgi:hypothetical protein
MLRHPLSSCLRVAAALTVLASPLVARADATDACIQASDEGQVLRDRGKLIAARERFVACSNDTCPRLVRTDCVSWLADIDKRIPSVVLSATDPDGNDTADVTVTMDGAALASRLEARAITVDPGPHRFRFERAGSPPVDEKVILREGELRREVVVRFSRTPRRAAAETGPSAGSRPSRGAATAAIALFGVTLASGGLFAYFGATALRDADHLRATCAGSCSPDDVDAIRTREIVANVALGTGLAAAAAGTLTLLVGPKEPAPSLTVEATPGGGIVSLGAHF